MRKANKGKMWRRLANKLSVTVPMRQTVKDEAGNESEIVVPMKMTLTGKDIRNANRNKVAAKAPCSNLMYSLMARGGYLIDNPSDVTINNDQTNGEINEAV